MDRYRVDCEDPHWNLEQADDGWLVMYDDVAELEEKLKVAEEALTKISLNFWKKGDDFCHPEGCESPGIAKDALAKINARITAPG